MSEATNTEATTKARKALERVFYWLAMGDEGTEASLPDAWAEATPSEQNELSGLMEDVRVAAIALGGLQEPDEDAVARHALEHEGAGRHETLDEPNPFQQ